jgi:hypothetical protein
MTSITPHRPVCTKAMKSRHVSLMEWYKVLYVSTRAMTALP